LKRIYFTVTNDLSFDQRMHRICSSLSNAGYNITLVGRKLKRSLPLKEKNFQQKRIRCFFNKGFLFYAEYNVRVFFFLLFRKMDAICAIDLDTILPCLLISGIKNVPRIYDAHEFFTEMKEVRTRTTVKKVWLAIERFALPRFSYGYTVSAGLAEIFNQQYKKNFLTIRNLPVLKNLDGIERKKYIVAQGAVNEARGFEWLIPAMQKIDYKLVICGDGNFMPQLKKLIANYGVEAKIELKGMLLPDDLWVITQEAWLGLALAESEGTHQFLALPNKFFDYIQAATPQIAMAFPEYERVNRELKVAVLIDQLSVDLIANTVNRVMEDDSLLKELHANCLSAREKYNWHQEEKILVEYYDQIFAK
jgi:glycosyltransferase involved in cell wall biosynthesis